tara:strand:+ start:453 stop:785 length:333 start_codon:yes stop_codon:yes gene_type:complete
MSRGAKGAFGIDMQRGEGSAAREEMLREVPLEGTDNLAATGGTIDATEISPNAGNVFKATDKTFINPLDELPPVEGYEVDKPESIDRTNAILASINDLLGGSEEATALMR